LFILLIGLEDLHCITILVDLYVFVIKLGHHSKILNSYLLMYFVNFKICFNIHIDVYINYKMKKGRKMKPLTSVCHAKKWGNKSQSLWGPKVVVATLVKHIYNRLSTAQNIYSKNKIKKLELELTFHVKSEDGIS
jgi:hypothetical protein